MRALYKKCSQNFAHHRKPLLGSGFFGIRAALTVIHPHPMAAILPSSHVASRQTGWRGQLVAPPSPGRNHVHGMELGSLLLLPSAVRLLADPFPFTWNQSNHILFCVKHKAQLYYLLSLCVSIVASRIQFGCCSFLTFSIEMQALRWEPFCSKVWLIESGRPNSIPSSFTQRKVAISSRSNPDAPSIIVGDERFEPWTSASEVYSVLDSPSACIGQLSQWFCMEGGNQTL